MPNNVPAPETPGIVIPVYPGVDLLDVTGPYELFHWTRPDDPAAPPALNVQVVAEQRGLITTGTGLSLYVDQTFADADPKSSLWTPGGDPGALVAIMQDPKQTYLNFLRRQAAKAPYVCSVCEGALLLAAAGLLDGCSATTHWAFVPCLKAQYPKVKVVDGHPRFVLDRNRLTGAGISSGLDEALQLIGLILGLEAAQDVQSTTEYFPDPPVRAPFPVPEGCPLKGVGPRTNYGVSGWSCAPPR